MALYIVDYDLNAPGKNYDGLIQQIKTYSWAKVCKSSWAISSMLSVTQIRDSLSPFLDSGDRLFVANFDAWAAWNLPQEVANWIKSHS